MITPAFQDVFSALQIIEIGLVETFEGISLVWLDADVVLYHQVGQTLPIDQDYLLGKVADVFAGFFGESG